MLEGTPPFPENVFAPVGAIDNNQFFNITASSVDTWEILPMFVPVPEPPTGGLAILGLALAGAMLPGGLCPMRRAWRNYSRNDFPPQSPRLRVRILRIDHLP
jgi:hypothetical protein